MNKDRLQRLCLTSQQQGFLQSVVFTGTVLLSAFLLFWVQPLFAKMILPILGGSSAVWTASMLFFQLSLLGGYVYAHCSGKFLSPKFQVVVHLLLFGLAGLTLPFYLDSASAEPPDGTPVFWLLSLAVMSLGPPLLMISATAPMLQRWFAMTAHRHRGNPYFLYAASNLGSFAALVCFPALLEPQLGVMVQSEYWQGGYFFLQVCLLIAGLITINSLNLFKNIFDLAPRTSLSQNREISAGLRLSWVFLAFIPSSLMLGLTSHVTVDIAPVAMFWVIPLALYLLSFVVVFSRWQGRVASRGLAVIVIFTAMLIFYLRYHGYDKTLTTAGLSVVLHLCLFFAAALLLHGLLSGSKPGAAHLTDFYLCLSIGGMLGGFFNALIAPMIFNQIYEYAVMVAVVCVIAFWRVVVKRQRISPAKVPLPLDMVNVFLLLLGLFFMADMLISHPITAQVRRIFFCLSLTSMVIVAFAAYLWPKRLLQRLAMLVMSLAVTGNFLMLMQTSDTILLARSFYGALKVKEKRDLNNIPYHLFIHGSTRHNMQKFGADSDENQEPLMYFHRQANIGNAVASLQEQMKRPMHMGFVGLGAGAMSAYLRVGDTATFYEIDPEVVAMATDSKYFTFVKNALGNIEILVGDARLQLNKARDSSFDLLLIDAFSSDAIPVHLLTAEAVTLYLRKLKDEGLLLFHLSNRYLDLYKVFQGLDLPSGYALYYASKLNVPRPVEVGLHLSGIFSHSQVVIIAKETALPQEIVDSARWFRLERDPDFRTWTDDFSHILGVLKLPRGESIQ